LQAQGGGVGIPGHDGHAVIEPDERLLEFEVVELDACVLVKSIVVAGESVSGLEGASGLLGIALLEERIGILDELAGLADLVLLQRRQLSDVALRIEGMGSDELFVTELESALRMADVPAAVEIQAPGYVLEGRSNLGPAMARVSVRPRADAVGRV
jgi:hypothetical protein